MTSIPTEFLNQPTNGLAMLMTVVALVCQTLAYGVYATLIPFSAYILLKRNPKSRANLLMYCAIFMFILATCYLAASLTTAVLQIKAYYITYDEPLARRLYIWASLPNAIILINYVLTDAVVVWRAWVICKDEYQKALWVPIFFLGCTALSVSGTIGIRISLISVALDGVTSGPILTKLTRAIDVSQVTNLVLTLLTNMIATGIVARKAWRHRRAIGLHLRSARDRRSKVERIFTLIIESGSLYILSGLTVLVATLIRLPYGTLGDIYTPVNVQVAGIYPTVVLVLVSMQRGLDETTFHDMSDVQDESSLEFQRANGSSGRGTSTRVSNGQYHLELPTFHSLKIKSEFEISSQSRSATPQKGDIMG